MSKYLNPSPQETELVGRWVISAGKIVDDDVCRRVDYLVNEGFVRLAVDASGWLTLYQDPLDGRYWELSYPESGQSGGGAPKLTVLTREDADEKYKLA